MEKTYGVYDNKNKEADNNNGVQNYLKKHVINYTKKYSNWNHYVFNNQIMINVDIIHFLCHMSMLKLKKIIVKILMKEIILTCLLPY